MVGLVLVSHSSRVAEGAAELAREMGGDEVAIETAGGLDPIEGPDGPTRPIGTDAALVMRAIERAWSDDGVLVLMDLGSAVMSAEMALDALGDDRRDRVVLCDAPFVEGAVAAAVTAKLGSPLEVVATQARAGLAGKSAHLGVETPAVPAAGASPEEPGAIVAVLPVDVPHGLHARPAARFVVTAAAFDASVSVRNRSTGAGPADAASLNGVATLGVAAGHELEVAATGPQAASAVEALQALAARGFDEPDVTDTTPLATEDVVSAAREGVLAGSPASPGVAVGPARRLRTRPLLVPDEPASDPAAERSSLDSAIAGADAEIERQRIEVAARAGDEEAAIFDAHRLFLRDAALLGPARGAIDGGDSAARAWRDAVERVAAGWDALDDPYLRARATDLRSVGDQVLARILGTATAGPRLDVSGVVVAADLAPADAAALDPTVADGVVTVHGGPTSHAAVLARALGIPAVVGVGEAALAVADGTMLGVDGSTGEVHVAPDADTLARLRVAMASRADRAARLSARAAEPAVTTDGVGIEVAANVGRPSEVDHAVAAGADGVGLFRTEFLFMDRDTLPDEDEQETAYRAAAEALAGRPLLVRTLDAGADKPVRSLGQTREANPFLGERGIRFGLARPDVLRSQLRAVLRVAADHPVRVMFPMVATVDELAAALDHLASARADVAVASEAEVGIMVEVPAAALTARALAERVDFFSIGTNDLTQYTLAADRGNARVAALHDPLHPGVLRLIADTVEGAAAHGRWVGVCGEIAGDPTATRLLVGLGVRELSMAAPAVAEVKEAVRSTDAGAARELASEALTLSTAAAVRALLGSP